MKLQRTRCSLRTARSPWSFNAVFFVQSLAEDIEKGGNKGQAVEYYSQAAQLFEAENSTSEASKCRQKVGSFSCFVTAASPGGPGW